MSTTSSSPTIVILHGATGQSLPPDELDVFDEVEAVAPILRRLGYEPVPLTISLELQPVADALAQLNPVGVFNLVEAINGQSCFAHQATALLDTLRIPYTGCPTAAIRETTDKLLTKQSLLAHGISTPAWLPSGDPAATSQFRPSQWIIKPVCEDASIGVESSAVVQAETSGELQAALSRRHDLLHLEVFAEAYVEGRELAVAMIEEPAGVLVLPPAEILFVDFPAHLPRIVDYRAKWLTESFEYIHTPRSLAFPVEDAPLLAEVRTLARRCWELFGLRGYARVDFRVDEQGRPWVLEVNTNPSLGQDSGFLAAVHHHGKDADWAIQLLVQTSIPVAAN
jgi:D-alanine-D-alanine ligase